MIASIAKANNIPVVLCCETYKVWYPRFLSGRPSIRIIPYFTGFISADSRQFTERVQTDAFVYNELGKFRGKPNQRTLSERYPLLFRFPFNHLTGDPNDLVTDPTGDNKPILQGWEDIKHLKLLSLR